MTPSSGTTPSRAVPEHIEARTALADRDVDDVAGSTGPVRIAIALALIGGGLVAVAPVLSVVRADDGAVGSGVPGAALLAAACGLGLPVIAVVALLAKRVEAAGGLLAAAGAVAVAAAVLDLQLLVRPIDANRPELFRPLSAALLSPGPGSWFVFAGHVSIVLAGIAGLFAVSRAALLDGYGGAADDASVGRSVAGRVGTVPAVVAGLAAVVVAVSAFAAPFVSTDSVFLVPTVVDGPTATLVGSGLLAFAVLAVTAAGLSSMSVAAASAAFVGAGVAALAVFGVRWAAALAGGARIDPGFGSVLGAGASVVLVVVGVILPISNRVVSRPRSTEPNSRTAVATTPKRTSKSARAKAAAAASAAASRRSYRWHLAAGVTGIVAGLLLGAGSVLPLLQIPGDVPEPNIVGVRVALLAAVITILVSVLLMFSELGAAVRPVAGVFWVAAITASTPVLQALVLALGLPGVHPGIGSLAITLGVLCAGVFGLVLWVAGCAERDDIDTSPERSVSSAALWTGAVGAVASFVGLGLPLYRSDASTAATFGEFPWGWDSWGQAGFGVAVVVALVVAARSRRARACALLLGAALGMVVYIAGWPLAGVRTGSTTIGPGVIPAVVGALALLAAALLVRRTRE